MNAMWCGVVVGGTRGEARAPPLVIKMVFYNDDLVTMRYCIPSKARLETIAVSADE